MLINKSKWLALPGVVTACSRTDLAQSAAVNFTGFRSQMQARS
jgi:hypothetical protein